MIGIAWLKDKNAITRQRLSIAKRDVVKSIWWINVLLAWLRKKGSVVTATYGDHMLKLGENTGNRFELVLVMQPWSKHTDELSANWDRYSAQTKEFMDTVATIFDDIAEKWVPNYFWEQRFWHLGNNWKIWYDLLAGNIRNIKWDKNTLAEKRFKVQAFSSYVFNEYLKEREKKWLLYTKIVWDILWKDKKTILWPVPWDDLAPAGQDAATLEKDVFARVGLSQQIMNRFKTFGLFWIRRPLLIYPKHIKHTWRGKVLMVSFELPAGAYATVVLDQLEKRLQEHYKGVNIASVWNKKHYTKPQKTSSPKAKKTYKKKK